MTNRRNRYQAILATLMVSTMTVAQAQYTYGSACGTVTDGECARVPGCTECAWSWPANDSLEAQSLDAKCRCRNPEHGSVEASGSLSDYYFGGDCGGLADQDCGSVSGCNRCQFSYPVGDSQEWSSPNAKCRCSSVDSGSNGSNGSTNSQTTYSRDELLFGNDCDSLSDQECSDVSGCQQCRYTVPKNDPLGWNSPEGACRCTVLPGETLPNPPSSSFEPLIVDVDGVDTTLYVQYPRSWSSRSASDTDRQLSFDHNNRMYLSTQQEIDRSAYFTPNMLGGSLEYDVDLSSVGCGCITAVYSVLMPAVDNPSDFGYCDANKVDDSWCPEFDIMEANKYAFRATGHTCDAPDASGKYHQCDRGGQCSIDVLRNNVAGDYMPGSTSGIDTNQEFHMKIEYHKDSAGQFSGYTVTMTQGTDRQVQLSSTDCSYLNGMTSDIQQMAFAISNWSSANLDWLQHNECQGTCNTDSTFSQFKNFVFRTANHVPTPPVVDPVDNILYKYDRLCRPNEDQSLCGEDCRFCMVSSRFEDTTGNPDTACRCLPMQRAAQGYTYAGGNPTSNKQKGICNGCDDCRMSWPKDDVRRRDSPEAMFRCKPAEPAVQLSYGPECTNKYDMLCGADCHQCRESWPIDDPRKWLSDQAYCRCREDQIREVVFSQDSCPTLDSGLCGTHCREGCLMSWEALDTLGAGGPTAACRCKRSW